MGGGWGTGAGGTSGDPGGSGGCFPESPGCETSRMPQQEVSTLPLPALSSPQEDLRVSRKTRLTVGLPGFVAERRVGLPAPARC